jgi:hypothetical protein
MRRAAIVILAAAILIVGAAISSIVRAEIDEPNDDQTVMQAAALLFHGQYGEQPYKLTYTTSGALVVEETGRRVLRFVVRRVPGKRCVFQATHDNSGLNIEQLDFTKFDGSRRLVEACGEKGTVLENICTVSLHFDLRPGGFCQYQFSSGEINQENVPFPAGACRSFGYGAREKASYGKYMDAFDRIYKQCAASSEGASKR